MKLNISQLNSTEKDFSIRLKQLIAFESAQDDNVDQTVKQILQRVKTEGDSAILEYTKRFDFVSANRIEELTLLPDHLKDALNNLPAEQRNALEIAHRRITTYHEKQCAQSWYYMDEDNSLLGQQITPLDRVGLYVPGGKAAYPSSVLMNAIPAKVAGVKELIMVVPTPNGERNMLVLAAASLAGVDKVLCIGGAQAVAGLAYGSETIPQVDKIVGPGNCYVASAKRHVFGVVGIDMVAGPSEILIICDGKTSPYWIAMDLFSQAEHDELAQSILLSPDKGFLEEVLRCCQTLLSKMPRREIILKALNNRGALIQVRDLEEAIDIANFIAPEHLELSIENALEWSQKVKHAGAIFIGRQTCEAFGDYCAGPNHVLPTSRTARFSSALGVYDFQKRSNILSISKQALSTIGQVTSILAHGEGLTAHAQSAQYRMEK